MLDEWESLLGPGRVYVSVHEYRVVKVTPHGVRLDNGRFVLRDARKRFACPTIEEAVESFMARKSRQMGILHRQIEQIEEAIAMLPAKVEREYKGELL